MRRGSALRFAIGFLDGDVGGVADRAVRAERDEEAGDAVGVGGIGRRIDAAVDERQTVAFDLAPLPAHALPEPPVVIVIADAAGEIDRLAVGDDRAVERRRTSPARCSRTPSRRRRASRTAAAIGPERRGRQSRRRARAACSAGRSSVMRYVRSSEPHAVSAGTEVGRGGQLIVRRRSAESEYDVSVPPRSSCRRTPSVRVA